MKSDWAAEGIITFLPQKTNRILSSRLDTALNTTTLLASKNGVSRRRQIASTHSRLR